MKRVKKDAASFNTLSASQMGKVKGGQWVEVRNPDGSTTTVSI
jgi:transcription elongation GreA/GreB family factor